MYKLHWIADALRNAGLPVVEEPGWKDRGRGEMGEVKGVICHHTGPGSDINLKNLVRDGRSDLPGPLSQLFLDRQGVWYVLAAGRCNHAGKGKWQSVTAGNSQMIGIEAANAGDGKETWPIIQLNSYARGCAALLSHIKADDVMAAGHKEYATPKGRKVDPSFDMFKFRESIAAAMGGTTVALPTPAAVSPVYAMLQKGSQGNDVKKLQKLLADLNWYTGKIDGGFGPKTENAVKAFQKSKGLLADGKVGPKTWTALGIK